MNNRSGALENWIFVLFLFLLPTQLALHLWPPWAFIFGIRVDFLAPAIYLTDVLAAAILILWFFRDAKWVYGFVLKYRVWVFVAAAVMLLNIIFSTSIPVSSCRWIKVLEFSLVALYVFRQRVMENGRVFTTLFWSSVIFSIIGIFQVIEGGTLGGIFYFLGERSFTSATPGIALADIYGRELLRAYSTFSHPNSLAGFLGVVLLLNISLKKVNVPKIIGLLIILMAFILTFSLAAITALVVAMIIKKRWTRLIFGLTVFLSLLLPLVSRNIAIASPALGQNISQRLDLAYLSGKMISEKFLTGEGLGTFIINIPGFNGIAAYQWLLQPVHNIFLLVFAETGIAGFLLFCFVLYKYLARILNGGEAIFIMVFVFVVLTGFLDHYWLTLQQNFLLLSILAGISFRIGAWRKG